MNVGSRQRRFGEELDVNTQPHQLDGKTALVTGGGRGIGKMITEGLLRAGARVCISSRKEADLEGAVKQLSPLGEVSAFAADLGSLEGVTALASYLREREARLDVLVNNAGATWGAPVDDFPLSAWDKVMDLNVKGVFALTQALLPLLKAAASADEPSRVINIGSIDGLSAPPPGWNNFSYSASKAALHMLTRQLATTLAPDILVNAVAPGVFENKMTAAVLKAAGEAVTSHIPLRRLGRPADMAGIAVFLAGPDSSFITGAVIPVDGGVTAGR